MWWIEKKIWISVTVISRNKVSKTSRNSGLDHLHSLDWYSFIALSGYINDLSIFSIISELILNSFEAKTRFSIFIFKTNSWFLDWSIYSLGLSSLTTGLLQIGRVNCL